MKKKITIVSLGALVVLVSMTSSLFAGLFTTSFKYDFWNANPWVGTSYGVTYLKSIAGVNMNRDLGVFCKVLMNNNSMSTLESEEITTNATSIDIHAQSDRTDTAKSWHKVSLDDYYATVTTKEMSDVKDCHKTGTLTPVDPY